MPTSASPCRSATSVVRRSREIGLDPAYVYGLIRQESRFVMDARSGVGASGLMQVMPATARWTARKIGMTDFTLDQLNDRDTNIAHRHRLPEAGARRLRRLACRWPPPPTTPGPSRPRSWRNGPGDRGRGLGRERALHRDARLREEGAVQRHRSTRRCSARPPRCATARRSKAAPSRRSTGPARTAGRPAPARRRAAARSPHASHRQRPGARRHRLRRPRALRGSWSAPAARRAARRADRRPQRAKHLQPLPAVDVVAADVHDDADARAAGRRPRRGGQPGGDPARRARPTSSASHVALPRRLARACATAGVRARRARAARSARRPTRRRTTCARKAAGEAALRRARRSTSRCCGPR